MAKKPKRIHVNRSDMGIVLVLIVLVSGMTFSLGILLGFSFGETRGVEDYLASQASPSRALASQPELPAAEMSMMASFNASKQEALNTMLSQQSKNMQPKSIADAQAYFDELSEKDVEIAKTDVPTSNRAPAQAKEKEKSRIPASIKPLFEASLENSVKFAPTPEEWTIQVASYPSQEQAEAKLLHLNKNKILNAYVKKQINSDGTQWFSLYVGSFKDKAWSSRFAIKLKRRKLIANFHVKKVP